MNQNLRVTETREVSAFFSFIHLCLFFSGFCYYYDKFHILVLGISVQILENNAGFFFSYFVNILGASID